MSVNYCMRCGCELRSIDYCDNETVRAKEARANQPHYTKICDNCKAQYTATIRAEGNYKGEHVKLLTVRVLPADWELTHVDV